MKSVPTILKTAERLTLSRSEDGFVRILPGPYDFDQHGSYFSDYPVRNLETRVGFACTSWYGMVIGNDFTINYAGSPNVYAVY